MTRKSKSPTPKEDSRSIAKWGDETFGVATSMALAERAREELDELMDAIKAQDPIDKIVAEAADVVILLHRLTGDLDSNLYNEVNKKMAINRKRLWRLSGDGTGQHS